MLLLAMPARIIFFLLRLPPGEFAAAKNTITLEVKQKGIPQDHYLWELSNEELKNILLQEDEWSREDYAVAKILMEDRSQFVSEADIKKAKEENRIKEQAKQTISVPVLILLYLIAPLGSLVPVVAGLIIYTMKDYDLDGIKTYVYADNMRQNGLIILAIGILSTLWWVSELLWFKLF
ncbi:hypothetical protein BH11BAC6_BH11BAC6_18090 [soil metagenome]